MKYVVLWKVKLTIQEEVSRNQFPSFLWHSKDCYVCFTSEMSMW